MKENFFRKVYEKKRTRKLNQIFCLLSCHGTAKDSNAMVKTIASKHRVYAYLSLFNFLDIIEKVEVEFLKNG
jgi:hypothetical protein